ncbi:hypothetical protein [Glutamicibacter nicotianae]|uniref:hypothetical protein n=1 Tax=Glutamicibacter nicotianae TaxID=37929 RepID=UPI0013CE71AD|nr:hypothetical protein [Glutamicibacter nicotianae]
MENFSDPYFVGGLIAVALLTALLTVFSELRKERRQAKWERAWIEAGDAQCQELYLALQPVKGFEGFVTRVFMHQALRESHAFVIRQTESERLGVPMDQVDRALLAEACHLRGIAVHPQDGEDALASKLARKDVRDGAVIADRQFRSRVAG